MAYTKTVWVDNSAPAIDATNLNNIEIGVELNDTNITTLQTQAGAWFTKVVGDDATPVASFDKIFVDTTGGAFSLILPAVASDGDTVRFVDVKGNFATATFTITVAGGEYLMGNLNGTLDLVTNNDFVDMTYFAADTNWIITAKP